MQRSARLTALQQHSGASRCSRQMRLPVRAVSSVRPASSPAASEQAGPSGLQCDDRLSDVAQRLERSLEASSAVARGPQPEPFTDTATASASASATTPAIMRDAQGREIILAPGETLSSEWQHRAWVAAGFGVMGALFAAGAVRVNDAPSAAAAAAVVISAYVFADLLSGVYHWGVDNYGDGATPVFGSQIAGFQAHHQRPWTITQRQFANNVHKVFMPSTPFAAVFLAASPWLPGWACIWLATATVSVALAQQSHAWAHMRKSELPAVIVALQDAGVLVSRRAHGAHHRAPFEGNYCIVSGIWNSVLDQGGSDRGFFRRLERLVAAATGVEPRCWYEPRYEWEEDNLVADEL